MPEVEERKPIVLSTGAIRFQSGYRLTNGNDLNILLDFVNAIGADFSTGTAPIAPLHPGSTGDQISYYTGSTTAALTPLTSFARTLIDDADAAAARATLGLDQVNNTSDAAKNVSPVFTGDPKAPTPPPGDNDNSIATTAFVAAAVTAVSGVTPSNAVPLMDGNAASGTSTLYSRGDHVHPSDTSRAALVSPTFTGTPAAPTAPTADNSTTLATTGFVKAQAYAAIASPTFTGDPRAPTPAPGDNDTSIATTAFVTAAIAAGASIVAGPTPPVTPAANALWWDSVGGQLYLWFNDGNSSQWVVANNTAAGVASFNGRQGAVTLSAADLTNATPAAMKGVIDGTVAPGSGLIGEVLTASTGSPVSLGNGNVTNITSITLSSGDWDIWGYAAVLGSAAVLNVAFVSISNVSGTHGLVSGQSNGTTPFTNFYASPPMRTIGVSANSQWWLVAQANFASGTASAAAGAFISARRVR